MTLGLLSLVNFSSSRYLFSQLGFSTASDRTPVLVLFSQQNIEADLGRDSQDGQQAPRDQRGGQDRPAGALAGEGGAGPCGQDSQLLESTSVTVIIFSPQYVTFLDLTLFFFRFL